METVKDGQFGKPEEWKKKVRCTKKKNNLGQKGCGAEFMVEVGDLLRMVWYGTHFEHSYSGFKCKQCGKYNSTGEIPDLIWERVKKESPRVFDGLDDSIC